MDYLLVIDRAIALITGLLNMFGAGQVVSDIIAKRISEGGRDWTDAERQAVRDDLAKNKAYAQAQLGLPIDPAAPPSTAPVTGTP